MPRPALQQTPEPRHGPGQIVGKPAARGLEALARARRQAALEQQVVNRGEVAGVSEEAGDLQHHREAVGRDDEAVGQSEQAEVGVLGGAGLPGCLSSSYSNSRTAVKSWRNCDPNRPRRSSLKASLWLEELKVMPFEYERNGG